MIPIPKEIKDLVFDQLQKPIFVFIGISVVSTFTSGLLIGRWYGSRKIRQFNKRDFPKVERFVKIKKLFRKDKPVVTSSSTTSSCVPKETECASPSTSKEELDSSYTRCFE
jgi:hypothetical protein